MMEDVDRMPQLNYKNAGKPWNSNDERRLITEKLVKDHSFDEISQILLRSPRALKLRFCVIVDRINWKEITVSVPPSVNPMDQIGQFILEGSTPRDIALNFPRQFIDNHTGVVSLWEHRNERQWRHIS